MVQRAGRRVNNNIRANNRLPVSERELHKGARAEGWSGSSDEKPWMGDCTTTCAQHRAVGRGYADGRVRRVEAIAASTGDGGVVSRARPNDSLSWSKCRQVCDRRIVLEGFMA
jgi:hypothetical protein